MAVAWEEDYHTIGDDRADVQESTAEFVDHGGVSAVFECEFKWLTCWAFADVPCHEVLCWNDVAAGEGSDGCGRQVGEEMRCVIAHGRHGPSSEEDGSGLLDDFLKVG